MAASAAQAREELARWTADLLVSDIGMPGEDGWAFIRHVRGLEMNPSGNYDFLRTAELAK